MRKNNKSAFLKKVSIFLVVLNSIVFAVSPVVFAQPVNRPSISKSDEEFLEKIERDTFRYFWENADPRTGLVADSSSPDSPCSIAAVGFGLTAICIAQKRGWIAYEQAYERVFKTLRSFRYLLKSEHGFYYHFVNMKDGRRAWESEVSSIDTALFLAGALFAAQYFKGSQVERFAKHLYERVDWQWMMGKNDLMCMGWTPESGFLNAYWDWYNEGILIYALAIGSPTYPIPPEMWFKWRREKGEYAGFEVVYSFFGSLFTYQFAHSWIDFRNLYDGDLNYWLNSINAAMANRQFCIDNSNQHKGYGEDSWGLTAGEGPDGYKGYGASPAESLFHDGTINPYGMAASIPLIPQIAIKSLKSLYEKYGDKIYGEYGFKTGFNLDRNWWGKDYIGIDQGAMLLMIENFRTGMVWEYFMRSPYINTWIELCLKKSDV